MSSVEKDFDRLALLDEEGWTANNHYHDFLLRRVPPHFDRVLEIGCGTGAFSRRLARIAEHVTAIDLSSEMIRVARSRSVGFSNITFEVADAMTTEFATGHFDCVASIATLHHLPVASAYERLKQALKPGGMLIVLDLLEPERRILSARGLRQCLLNIVATGASCGLRLLHNGRLRPPEEVRAAWEDHGKTDSYLTVEDVRSIASQIFPGASVREHLLWRYSLLWRKQE